MMRWDGLESRRGMGSLRQAGWVAVLLLAGASAAWSQIQTAPQLVATMLEHEGASVQNRGHFLYTSVERSERTGGRLWTERVAETSQGRIRILLAEDGQPLSPQRSDVEHARLADIIAHPEAFLKKEQAAKNDEEHAQKLLALLPKAFLFENPRFEGAFTRIDYKPNPDYTPQSLEERVLHGMSGSLLVDSKALRLHRVDGTLPQDVSIGFGFLATIQAGSRFSTTRDITPGGEWKTTVIDTDIKGRAIFFKSLGKKEHAEHSNFHNLPYDITLSQAVEAVQKTPEK